MSRSFNGVSDYILANHAASDGVFGSAYGFSEQRPYAVSLWIKGAAQTTIHVFYSEGGSGTNNQFLLLATSPTSGKASVTIRGNSGGTSQVNGSGTFASAKTVFDNSWHHLLFTQDGAATCTWGVYIDGVLDTNLHGTYTAVATSCNELCIGADQRSGIQSGRYFAGLIAHVAVWHRQITAEEAEAIYAGLSPLALSPFHYWPLDGNGPEPDRGYALPAYGTLVGTTQSADAPSRAAAYVPRGWVVQRTPLLRPATTTGAVSDSDAATETEGAESIIAAVSGSDTATETEGTPAIALAAADTATVSSETASVAMLTDIVKSSSDSATADDEVVTGTSLDFDTFNFTETGSVAALTDTIKSDSDSATESESSAVVGPASGISSSDSATVTDSGSVTVVPPSDLNDHDQALLAELYKLLVAVTSSDSATATENDGGPPGGGGAGDGGGTGSGGGVGVKVKFARRHIAARI